jgi:hypothetical protein
MDKMPRTNARAVADEMEAMRMGSNRDLINKARLRMGRTPRTEEEMGELTREVARSPELRQTGGRKYASGGSVTRADGCCKKGHTKGKMR